MKTKITMTVILIMLVSACQKDRHLPAVNSGKTTSTAALTLEEIKTWYHSDTTNTLEWKTARQVVRNKNLYWLVDLAGRPVYNQLKLGYRRVAFFRDTTGAINQHMLEIIPDAFYLQQKQKVTEADFTGKIFTFDSSYRLLSGYIYSGGKAIGLIKPQPSNSSGNTLHTNYVQVITTCQWVDDNYIDSEGNVVVYSEKIRQNEIIDDGSSGILTGGGGDGSGPGTAAAGSGGGSSSGAGAAPAASNLPGENNPKVNPKNLMICFDNIPDNGAKLTITVYVQEPWPGTTFNIGPNSVGHTAIGLTKSNGNQSITQVVGFYPDASGKDKSHAPSKIVNNGGDLNYNASISYSVTADQFKKIATYISNPPSTYDIITMNCTTFVNNAVQQGGIVLPNASTTAGYDSDGNEYKTMAPSTLGYNIEKLDGKPNVNAKGGTTPNSKGSCDPTI
ncbi:hypothetical protein PQ469_12110 [Mucilaginibacter sp. KACC 22773]|uniref:hypothetical protein n=1 Tax=Mucilaginibacter sp. KACC 22773 TaxID=3025671 RepID=UPI0023669B49|nr:hypothetical protein [Mucilaginibacter sp. KACC 22773]WDF80751.1 hypothetical protein PQ469_12110 [Mucilaginibacter sp. KACC 22773]